MNPQAILEAARAAVAAGESPDDVARWIQDATGMTIDELAERGAAELRVAASGNPVTDFVHQAAETAALGQADKLAGVAAAVIPGGKGYAEGRDAFQQRTHDLQSLAPGASRAASLAPLAAGGAVAGLRGLGAAARAIQSARVGVPRATGLLDALGRPVTVPTTRSALEALRTLASPAMQSVARGARGVGRTLPWVGLGGALEAVRRATGINR